MPIEPWADDKSGQWLAFSLPGDFFKGTRDLAVVGSGEKTGQLDWFPAMDKAQWV